METSLTPNRAGRAAPESGERNPPASEVPLTIQSEKQQRNSAVNVTSDQATFAALSTQAAMRRCALYPLADGGYIVTRTGCGLSKIVQAPRSVARLPALMEQAA